MRYLIILALVFTTSWGWAEDLSIQIIENYDQAIKQSSNQKKLLLKEKHKVLSESWGNIIVKIKDFCYDTGSSWGDGNWNMDKSTSYLGKTEHIIKCSGYIRLKDSYYFNKYKRCPTRYSEIDDCIFIDKETYHRRIPKNLKKQFKKFGEEL